MLKKNTVFTRNDFFVTTLPNALKISLKIKNKPSTKRTRK